MSESGAASSAPRIPSTCSASRKPGDGSWRLAGARENELQRGLDERAGSASRKKSQFLHARDAPGDLLAREPASPVVLGKDGGARVTPGEKSVGEGNRRDDADLPLTTRIEEFGRRALLQSVEGRVASSAAAGLTPCASVLRRQGPRSWCSMTRTSPPPRRGSP